MDLFEGLPDPVAEQSSNQSKIDQLGDLPEPSGERNSDINSSSGVERGSKRHSSDEVEVIANLPDSKQARLSEEVDSTVKDNDKIDPVIPLLLRSYTTTRKGERPEMEDRHKAIDDFSSHIGVDKEQRWWQRLAFYGVFDGHAGSRASAFAAEHLHVKLAQEFPRLRPPHVDRSIKRALVEAFRRTDEEFLRAASRQRPHWRDGSTAVTALLVDNTVYTAHVGDSKAVLCRRLSSDQKDDNTWTPIALTLDHTPQDYEERQRIQRSGASVRDGRVDGVLEVSRSFGDYTFKKRGVVSLPAVRKYRLTEGTPLLILACDGLWHTVPPQEAARLAADTFKREEAGRFWLERASSRLAAEAVRRLSGDNVTVMLVAFEEAPSEAGQSE